MRMRAVREDGAAQQQGSLDAHQVDVQGSRHEPVDHSTSVGYMIDPREMTSVLANLTGQIPGQTGDERR